MYGQIISSLYINYGIYNLRSPCARKSVSSCPGYFVPPICLLFPLDIVTTASLGFTIGVLDVRGSNNFPAVEVDGFPALLLDTTLEDLVAIEEIPERLIPLKGLHND
uniref:Reverse transcriptase domain-containing protein n=1 Tax=Strongyloides venezuelensis TaxID=75913 RepID=A0A0K0FYS9_STRVS